MLSDFKKIPGCAPKIISRAGIKAKSAISLLYIGLLPPPSPPFTSQTGEGRGGVIKNILVRQLTACRLQYFFYLNTCIFGAFSISIGGFCPGMYTLQGDS